jgi:hypothetical protein
MKIHHLLNAPGIVLTNEETEFVNKHAHEIAITSLYDRDEVIARNLVRKGIYDISKDSRNMILKTNEKNSNTTV